MESGWGSTVFENQEVDVELAIGKAIVKQSTSSMYKPCGQQDNNLADFQVYQGLTWDKTCQLVTIWPSLDIQGIICGLT